MAQIKIVYTTSDKLPELPIENGQVIFVADVHEIYMDMRNKRAGYSMINVFATEAEREAVQEPEIGFYLVEETNILWRYKTQWIQLTPTGLNPIVFGEEVSSFPERGVEDTLYCGDDAIYKWNSSKNSYHLIANKNVWKEL